ncbi:glycosyltransferase family 52 [Enterobacter cloacae]|uniref:glycosyltransferase family 52 n=1 Tax=Enterobacter cloacae TaxID=550 RepID=UPI00325BD378
MKDNVFVFDSPYTLLIYCVLYPDYILNTIFIHSDNNALNQLNFNDKRQIIIKKGKGKLSKIFFYLLFKVRLLFERNLKEIIKHPNNFNYLGQDHLFFSGPFLHDFVLIEDGLANYQQPRYSKLYELILGRETFGRSDSVKTILLSGMKIVEDSRILNKVRYFDLLAKWQGLTQGQKQLINDFFNFTDRDKIEAEIIILTQPLSEYGFMKEEQKISIYSKLISEYGKRNIVIRKHPRENTSYSEHFPDLKINDSTVPIELIVLNSPEIQRCVTLFSGGIFNLPCKNKDFKGTSYHPLLVEKFGKITL